MDQIKMYGSNGCVDTQRSRAQMDALNVKYDFIDVDADPNARTEAENLNGGSLKIPTITFQGGGEPLIEPSTSELNEALRERQFIPA